MYVVLTVGIAIPGTLTGIGEPLHAAAPAPQTGMFTPAGLLVRTIDVIGLVPALQVAVKVNVAPAARFAPLHVGEPGGATFGMQVMVMLVPLTMGAESDWQPVMLIDCAVATPAVPNADASSNAAQPKRVRKRDVMVFSRINN